MHLSPDDWTHGGEESRTMGSTHGEFKWWGPYGLWNAAGIAQKSHWEMSADFPCLSAIFEELCCVLDPKTVRMERLWSFASHNPLLTHNSLSPRIQHYMTQQNLSPESSVDMKGPPPSICLWKHITDSRKNRLLITVTTGTSAVFVVCILIRLHFLSQAVCIQVISEKHILPRNSVCVSVCKSSSRLMSPSASSDRPTAIRAELN